MKGVTRKATRQFVPAIKKKSRLTSLIIAKLITDKNKNQEWVRI